MNRTKLKNYAPLARREFMQAITDRAAFYGLTAKNTEVVTAEQGDVAIIGGKPFPRAILEKRHKLIERIQQSGFAQTMEAIAYTWFNRFVAIRFMELHGYLDHGYRVLSHPEAKDTPEILLHAEHITLPGLNRDKVIELKLDGTKEAELYRLLLVAQCNALSAAMPFLFERVDDETELLLPDNLLHSDSLIRKLVNDIDESDWQQVEIIGWLYQFYISEKKDEVIGKVVKSEDIPAATQLFTPNWIVKYLVQNSIGRMWLQTYPASLLRAKMEYYIAPAEQTDEVNAQLAAIVPGSIDPETITVLDPACGSGHILVEAYNLLKEIYLERGYRLRDIPRLILGKNLFGLDIDDRAAQLASFALLMKARADDRRIFEAVVGDRWSVIGEESEPATGHRPPTTTLVNVLTIPDSSALSLRPHQLAESLFSDEARRGAIPIRESNYMFGEMEAQPSLLMVEEAPKAKDQRPKPQDQITEQDIIDLLERFEMGKTLGSLIRLPAGYGKTLADIAELIADKRTSPNWMEQIAARQIEPFVRAAEMLHAQYDCVIANPPYMGGKYQTSSVKEFAKRQFPDSKSDLFAMFIERNFELTKPNGLLGFMTPFVWMFLTSYEKLRQRMTSEKTILSLVQPEYHTFFDSAYVPICAFVVFNGQSKSKGSFFDLSKFYGADLQPTKLLEAISNRNCGWHFQASSEDFKKIDGTPIAFGISNRVRAIFQKGTPFREIAEPKHGMSTGNNNRYLRLWFEVARRQVFIGCKSYDESKEIDTKWYPYSKGGEYRKWYGNNEFLVNWKRGGEEIKEAYAQGTNTGYRSDNPAYHFKKGITWGDITSSSTAFRLMPVGFLFDGRGSSCFIETEKMLIFFLGMMNSSFSTQVLKFVNPTLTTTISDISRIPVLKQEFLENERLNLKITANVHDCVALAHTDWDSFETSWDFQTFPLLRSDLKAATVEQSFLNWQHACQANIQRMQELETENNRLFIDAYGLQDELSPDVPEAQITLARADRSEDTKWLLSYALGCVMGRYSLDRAGLVYADSGNVGFDPAQYATFPADADGIVPVTEIEWFADDAAHQFEEFVGTAWSGDQLEANLSWIAESLGTSRDEDARTTIRRYFATGFGKDHLKTYKKRPIYWLFSSGKQRAFQCLVYLHRYHEGTLARMRTEYVIPLQGKIAARIERLEEEKSHATSTSHGKKIAKEQETLKKQEAELIAFDEKLRNLADKRIALDLDDGVKVNYGKFGDLLAEVKAVTGGSEE